MKRIAALGAVALACASPPEPPRGPAAPETPAPPATIAVAAPAPAPTEAPEPPEPPEPAPPEPPSSERITLKVPGDNPIEVVLGPWRSPQAIVYLHGVCGDPFAFESWTRAATAHATFISLRGDEKCEDRPGRFRWSFDYARLDRRIRAAIDLVDTHRSGLAEAVSLDREEVVLIGYSQGAHRAQWMAARYPERYRRVGLIALATEPSPHRLAGAERVLLIAGGWDARTHIFAGYEALKRAGRAVRYVELPKARHGEYGPLAEETMTEALDWLFK